MTRPVVFVVPGALAQRTGGYLYGQRVVDGLRAMGREVRVVERAHECCGVPQGELRRDVVADPRRGRGREGMDARGGKALP